MNYILLILEMHKNVLYGDNYVYYYLPRMYEEIFILLKN